MTCKLLSKGSICTSLMPITDCYGQRMILAECCLTAVRLQGLVRAEGAVVRQLSGSAAASPWRVLLKEGEQFVQVRREPGRCGFEADNLRWLSGFGRRLWFAWHVLMLPRPRSCCRVHGTVIESKC